MRSSPDPARARGRATETIAIGVTPPYPVVVGHGILARLPEWVQEARVAVVTDETVARLYADRVGRSLRDAGGQVSLHAVPPGEDSKSFDMLEWILRGFAAEGVDRGAAVLALGGGVVSDLAGYAAASYMRGIAFYVTPTTTLAMVDASVGGKTGINLPAGKNLVGAFWQPRAVIADVATLASLSQREFRLGAVEAFKHGLLEDPGLLDLPEDEAFAPEGDAGVLIERIARSIRVKAEVVAADEREAGIRAHLNLGHTLGHALEAVTDHVLPHGDAVAYGLLFASHLGRARGWADWTAHVERLLEWLQPAPLPLLAYDELAPYLQRDKKNRGGRIRFVLLEEVGRPRVVDDVTAEEGRAAWAAVQASRRMHPDAHTPDEEKGGS